MNHADDRSLGQTVYVSDDYWDTGDIAVPLRRYQPSRESAREIVLWLHCGGHTPDPSESGEAHAVASAIAATGRHVMAIDYRRPLREQAASGTRRRLRPSRSAGKRLRLDDVTSVYQRLRDDHPDRPIIIGGACATASMAVMTALHPARRGRHVPAGLILVNGSFHSELPTPSAGIATRVARHPLLLKIQSRKAAGLNKRHAAGQEPLDSPVFPGGGDVSALPPTLMIDADRDLLRASGSAFKNELDDARVPVEYHVVPHARRGFLDRPLENAFASGIGHITDWLDGTYFRAVQG